MLPSHRHPIAAAIVVVLCGLASTASVGAEDGGVAAAFEFLAREHDRNQDEFVIFDDRDSGYEHFAPSGWMGDMAHAGKDAPSRLQTNWTRSVHAGHTAVRWHLPQSPRFEGWGGVYWEYPEKNELGVGHDLSPYVPAGEPAVLKFWARRLQGTPSMIVGFRWVSESGALEDIRKDVNFGPDWKEYAIELPETARLKQVTGGFAISASTDSGDIELLLDDARICFGPKGRAVRTNLPRFVRSYLPESAGPPDRHFRNACYTYDNALIVLAFCARGREDDLRRARLICDAFVTMQDHDPAADGRLRSAYLCGELLDTAHGSKPRIPGYWDDSAGEWREDGYAASSDCGNMAWAAIALLECWDKLGRPPRSAHLLAARRLCEWIHQNSHSRKGAGGYTGGMETVAAQSPPASGLPPAERAVGWKSCEHNIDIYVAFSRLAQSLGGDVTWLQRAAHAHAFVDALLTQRVAAGHHALPTGTFEDGIQINDSVQPLDVNPWAMLAFRDPARFQPGVDEAARLCHVSKKLDRGERLEGFDFNEDKDGVWWEGTAQMSLAYHFMGRRREAEEVLTWMSEQGRSPLLTGAMLAASQDRLTTGFNRASGDAWVYWRRAQTGGATCWFIFAQMHWNPYWGEAVH